MKAAILAAGKGTRMGALAADIPKPLISVAGKNLLEHKLDMLPAHVSDVVMIVSHMKEKIMDYFGDQYRSPSGIKKIEYVDQGEAKGTGHALWQARAYLDEPFVTLFGDDIYSQEIIDLAFSDEYPNSMIVVPADSFKETLDIKTDHHGYLSAAEYDHEGTKERVMLDICVYRLQPDIFDAPLVRLQGKEEYGLPHTVIGHMLAKKIPMKVHSASGWHKLNSPEDVAAAETLLTGIKVSGIETAS